MKSDLNLYAFYSSTLYLLLFFTDNDPIVCTTITNSSTIYTLPLLQAKHQFEQLREEIRNKNLEEINMLRISLDAQIEDLEQLFETAHLNYLQQTAQRTHDFKELTHKDQILDVDINQKKKKIDNLQVFYMGLIDFSL